MDALIVIDMQEGIQRGAPKHDLDGVTRRINVLAERVRSAGGRVIFVQHHGAPGSDFAPSESGHELLAAITPVSGDIIVPKTLNDAFWDSELGDVLATLGAERLFITGWATDLCIDATVRAAAARGYRVVVVADGHTVSDRPHLPAPQVKAHHEWLWTHLIAPHRVEVTPADAVVLHAGAP